LNLLKKIYIYMYMYVYKIFPLEIDENKNIFKYILIHLYFNKKKNIQKNIKKKKKKKKCLYKIIKYNLFY